MIYFRDDLDQTLGLQIDSLKHTITISHSLTENDDDDSGICHDVTIAGVCNGKLTNGFQCIRCADLPTIGLCGDRSALSCLAEVAHVSVYHTSDNRLDTSLDFIRNYKGTLMGDCSEWRLCAVWVNPRETFFGYFNGDNREIECLSFSGCPFDIELSIPCAEGEPSNEPEDAYRKLFNMGSGQGETVRVIIHHNLTEKSAEVWTGKLDNGYDSENLKPGQRMLSVSYDEDGDIVLTRRYHDSDVDDETLPKLLVPKDFGTIFCL